ncbi:MAG: hypothetical protein MJ188_08030 [Treponema sp.]|nr:hypothetical protein [Treponema sp.]
MVSIFINGNPVDAQLEDEKTVGDVLKSFEITCEENNAAVIGINVNNKIITAENFDEEAQKNLSSDENTTIEFSVVTADSIKESFVSIAAIFDELADKMQTVPSDLQSGKSNEVSSSIKTLADSIDELCHIAALATLFPETFKSVISGTDSFNNLFEDFSPILKDFESALENNDTVLIGDLSEYEICPRLQKISSLLKTEIK